MRKPAKEKSQILLELTEVFRTNGYDGTTLSKLTERTGLERASLYHYFPGGKSAMAEAVLDQILHTLSEKVLSALTSDAAPLQRLSDMLNATDKFYNGGNDLCFVSVFAIGVGSDALTTTLQSAVAGWLKSLTTTLAEAKKPNPDALANAGLSCIQGGLILAVVQDDPKPFTDSLGFLRASWLEE